MSSTTLSIEGLLRNLLLSGSASSNRVSVSDVISRMIDGNTLSIRHYTKNVACRILRSVSRSSVNVENARRVLLALIHHYPVDNELADLYESFGGGDFTRHSVLTHEQWTPSPSPTPSVYQRLTTPTSRRSVLESYQMSKNLTLPASFCADSILRDISSSSDEEVLPKVTAFRGMRKDMNVTREDILRTRRIPILEDYESSRRSERSALETSPIRRSERTTQKFETSPIKRTEWSKRTIERPAPCERVIDPMYRLERVLDLKRNRDTEIFLRSNIHVWRDLLTRRKNDRVKLSRFVQNCQNRVYIQLRRSIYIMLSSTKFLSIQVPSDASRMGYVFEKLFSRRKSLVLSVLSNLAHLHSTTLLAHQQEEVWAVRSLLTNKVLRIAQSRIEEKGMNFAKKCLAAWIKYNGEKRANFRALFFAIDKIRKTVLLNAFAELSRGKKRESKGLATRRIVNTVHQQFGKSVKYFFSKLILNKFEMKKRQLGISIMGHILQKQKRWVFSRLNKHLLEEKILRLNEEKADNMRRTFLGRRVWNEWRMRIQMRKTFKRFDNTIERIRLRKILGFFQTLTKIEIIEIGKRSAINRISNLLKINFIIPSFHYTLTKMKNRVLKKKLQEHALQNISRIFQKRKFQFLYLLGKTHYVEKSVCVNNLLAREKRRQIFKKWKNGILLKKKIFQISKIFDSKNKFLLQHVFKQLNRNAVRMGKIERGSIVLSQILKKQGIRKLRRNCGKMRELSLRLMSIFEGNRKNLIVCAFSKLKLAVDEDIFIRLGEEFRSEIADRENAAHAVEQAATELHAEYEKLAEKSVQIEARNEEVENELVVIKAHYERVSRDSENLLFKLSSVSKTEEDLKNKLERYENEISILNSKLNEFEKIASSESFYKSKCLLQAEQIGSLQHSLRAREEPSIIRSPSSSRSRLRELPFNGYASPNSSYRYSVHATHTVQKAPSGSTRGTYSLDTLKRAVDKSASMRSFSRK